MRFGWHSEIYDGLSREFNPLKLALQIVGILENLMYFRVKMPNLQRT